ncbi:hypothetical protein DFQ27_005891 [Actinomortierella ambigua]|uniref:Uncharacterized protein n=1 Tax=Actinomortierella ambigua TaxID=1343610 RepID=A0A9P6PXH7_9FUNG|nr:hypothetical protein DFQ27_005891 [Actinomortierella ambigua]
MESLEEEDAVRLAQTFSHVPMNAVFDVENFEFTAKLGSIEFGEQFTAYYTHCQSLTYDADNLPDFVPTYLQKKYLGSIYVKLWDLIDARVTYPTPEEVMDAVRVCRDAKDTYKDTISRHDVEAGRLAMEKTIEKAPESTLRSLLLYGAKLHQHVVSFGETDQTSHLILGMLSHVMDRPDETRILHTADTPPDWVRSPLCNISTLGISRPHHPDVVIRYHEAVDIGGGKVSLSASRKKDLGDLARMLMWSKRAADKLATRFEGVEDMNILFMQIIGQTCNLYLLCRIGTVCVAAKIDTIKIFFTLSNALSFEDDVQTWLLLEKTFGNAVTVLNKGKRRHSARPPCFPGLATPRSRKMEE